MSDRRIKLALINAITFMSKWQLESTDSDWHMTWDLLSKSKWNFEQS